MVSQLIPKEPMAPIARRAFTQKVLVHQLHPFLDWRHF